MTLTERFTVVSPPFLCMEKNKMDKDRIMGKITKLSPDGWGFITTKQIEFTRIFFHWSALLQDTLGFKQLRVGMEVEFKPVEVPERGWRAYHIKVVPREKKKKNEVSILPEQRREDA